jgi:hypothetical protein
MTSKPSRIAGSTLLVVGLAGKPGPAIPRAQRGCRDATPHLADV